jgi:hypothetical protein
MGLLAIDFLFMEYFFLNNYYLKVVSVIALQILPLCVLQIKRELRIKCGCKIVRSCLQIFSWAKYGKISVGISANSFKRLTN